MIRIEFHDSTNTMTMRISGRFVEPFAENARALISPCRNLPNFVVNLSEVNFVDTVGEEVLSWFGQLGGEFVAENSYSLNVCERLNLPITGIRDSSSECVPLRRVLP